MANREIRGGAILYVDAMECCLWADRSRRAREHKSREEEKSMMKMNQLVKVLMEQAYKKYLIVSFNACSEHIDG